MAGHVTLRLSLSSWAAGQLHRLVAPFATAAAAERLIIDPRLVILPHGFERLDLNHQSNERPSTDRNDNQDRCPVVSMEKQKGKRMKRRDFIKVGGVGLAATAVASPAIAQSNPEIKWRLAASW